MLRFKHYVTLVMMFVFTNIQAQEAAVGAFKDFTPQQLVELTDPELINTIPLAYQLAAQSALAPGSELLFARQLNMLMYPGVSDYENAVKAFQRDLEDASTGQFTVSQIYRLEKRSELQKTTTIHFPSEYYSSKSEELATINGTWTREDAQIDYPVNHTQVKCYRTARYCERLDTYLELPDIDAQSPAYRIVQGSPQIFEITRWSEHEIEAKPAKAENGCQVTTLRLNFQQPEFNLITQSGPGGCVVEGKEGLTTDAPSVLKVVDGEKIFNAQFLAMKRDAYHYLSSEFRKRIDILYNSY